MQRILSLAALLLFLAAPVFAEPAPSYTELADAPTITVDWSKATTQAVTLHGNRALVFTNAQKGASYRLVITQDMIGSRTVTWPGSVRWPGVSAQVLPLTTLASKTDYLMFFYNGTTYDALAVAQNY